MVQSGPRHPLFTSERCLSGAEQQRGGSGGSVSPDSNPQPARHPPAEPAPRTRTSTRTSTGTSSMPCRKENYLFLEQSVSVDSKEVDALVTRIGEALQLHNNNSSGQKTVSVSLSCRCAGPGVPGGPGGGPGSCRHGLPGGSASAPGQKLGGCCLRLRSHRGHRGSSRASPYSIPGSNGDQGWEQIRPWNRKRLGPEEDDPHRLLQDLILSGNLIKEAVRRLHFSPADCAEPVAS